MNICCQHSYNCQSQNLNLQKNTWIVLATFQVRCLSEDSFMGSVRLRNQRHSILVAGFLWEGMIFHSTVHPADGPLAARSMPSRVKT